MDSFGGWVGAHGLIGKPYSRIQWRLAVGFFKQMIYGGICLVGLSGCATFKTLDARLPLDQRLFIYSGTRLD